ENISARGTVLFHVPGMRQVGHSHAGIVTVKINGAGVTNGRCRVHDQFSVGYVVGDNRGDFADEPLSACHRCAAVPGVGAVGTLPKPAVADNDLIVPITPERVVVGSDVGTGAGAIDYLSLGAIGEVRAGIA